METTKEDAAGIGTVVAGWEDVKNETRLKTTWNNKSLKLQSTMSSGATRGKGRQQENQW